jgi:hypothetical protein|tara:strand:+ start:3168 stop:3716 length:549 start_codon:yes stop_codon:yes gene_type:complete
MLHFTESKKPVGNQINPELNVCIVRESINGDKTWYYAKNIVTNDGDLFYAQQSVGETPTSDFDGSSGRMELRTGSVTPAKADTYTSVTTPVTASRKVVDSTYPKTNDSDSDNTGAGTDIVTWRTSWTTSDFSASAIIGGCIHVGAASPASSTKLLTHFSITSFDKTTSDTLKIFVNHTFNGV